MSQVGFLPAANLAKLVIQNYPFIVEVFDGPQSGIRRPPTAGPNQNMGATPFSIEREFNPSETMTSNGGPNFGPPRNVTSKSSLKGLNGGDARPTFYEKIARGPPGGCSLIDTLSRLCLTDTIFPNLEEPAR